jgi:glycosyltransferase involved in cell wall biosynthesis
MTAKDLSVIIPARNEEWLERTIDDILLHREMDTEVIVIFDGYWPVPSISDRSDVVIIHFTNPVGQRGAVNYGAAISRAKFIMKLDAHCCVDQGFDRKLITDCDYDWTVIPRMYHFHVFDWVCQVCNTRYYQADPVLKCKCECTEFSKDVVWKRRDDKPPRDYMRFDHTMHFQYWRRFERRSEAKMEVTDLMSSIGACFFMHRKRFLDLGGLDEAHGFWGQFGTEIACKSWLSGGRHIVNKNTWFAHFFRVGKLKFPYELSANAQERARIYSRDLWLNNKWEKQVRPLSWLIDKFAPIPDWHDTIGVETLQHIQTLGKEFTTHG